MRFKESLQTAGQTHSRINGTGVALVRSLFCLCLKWPLISSDNKQQPWHPRAARRSGVCSLADASAPLGFAFPAKEPVGCGGWDFKKKKRRKRRENRKEMGREEGKAPLLSAADLQLILERALPF